MKFTKVALSLLCMTVLFCGCAKNSDVVLKINDNEITRGEFYDGFNKIKDVQLKDAPKEMKSDGSYMVLALKERYVNDYIGKKLLEEEYVKRKIEASEEEIKAKKDAIIAQIGSEEKFKNILKENNISDKKLNEDFANEVKIEKLAKTLKRKPVTDADAQKYYNFNKQKFNTPERVRVSHILIDTNPENIRRNITDADKDAKMSSEEIDKKVKEEVQRKEQLAKELQQKASKNPKEFAALAAKYSDDEVTAKNGGDIGYIAKAQVVKEFGDAAFKQKVGTVSPLVKSEFGQHIIYVTDKAAAGMQSFASVKQELKAYLEETQKIEALQSYVDDLKKNAKIEFVDEALNPENLRKEMTDALVKQMDNSQKKALEKGKKVLDKTENENK